MKLTGCLLLGLLITGCSTRGVYEGIQVSSRQECARLPPSDYEECIRSVGKSYDQYQEELREAAQQD